MRIEHIALWTNDIERLKDFYTKYFNAFANKRYRNSKTGFSSYFLSFDEGSRLEIMQMDTNLNYFDANQTIGFIHLAISVGSKEKVLNLTEKLRLDGFVILKEPRTTGDGYFESVVLDPDNNQIEITI